MEPIQPMDDDRQYRPEESLDADLQKELDDALGEASLMDLVEQQEKSSPVQGGAIEGIRKGRVAAIQDGDIFVDFGGKTQGILPVSQFEEEKLPSEGDIIEFTVEGVDERDGLLILSRKGAVLQATWDNLQVGKAVEGRVTGLNKGGLEIDLSGIRAFMPVSHVELGHIDDLTPYLNQKLKAEVIELDRKDNKVVLSRRAMLQREQAEKARQTMESLSEGDVVEGVVKTIMPYGAFVDIGGVDGLVHVREMSHGHVNKPEDVVKPGENVTVKVVGIDTEKDRIALSLKELQADPWKDAAEKWPVDSIVTGRVVKLMDFGAFVELDTGVEALVPISEMTYERRIGHPREIVSEGEVIKAKVLKVEPGRKRMSLSIKQVEGDPWTGASVRWQEGSIVEGNVVRTADFGAFVQLAPGVEGLVHISELSAGHVPSVRDAVREGDLVKVKVLSVDEDARRIALSIKQTTEEGQAETTLNLPESKPRKRKKPLKGGLD